MWLVVVFATAACGLYLLRARHEPKRQAGQTKLRAHAPTEPSPDVSEPSASPERLHQIYLQRGYQELDHQNPKAALEYAGKAEALVSWAEDGESRHLEGLAYYAMGDFQGARVCLGEACISKVGPRAKMHYNLVIRRHPRVDADSD